MDHPYLPILILLLLGFLFAGTFLSLSAIIGPKKRKSSPAKLSPYECGLDPVGGARQKVDVKFSLIAMLFVVFDVEAVFLFPWAVLYKQFISDGMGLFMLIEVGIFVVMLALGFFYVWRKGALQWR